LNLWGTTAGKATLDSEINKNSVVYNGLKSEGCEWFKEKQKIVEAAPTVLVVGGGALGIREFLKHMQSSLYC